MVGVVLMREEKAFSGEKKQILQVAPNCAALSVFYFYLMVYSLDVTELSYQKDDS